MRCSRSIIMRRPGLWLALLLGAASSGCGDPTAATSRADVEARARWNATAPSSYEVTVHVGCFCPPSNGATILVTSGATVSARDPVTGAALSQAEAMRFPTVDMLFDEIARASAIPSAQVVAEYDATYGFPRQVSINSAPGALDSGVGYSLTDFHPR